MKKYKYVIKRKKKRMIKRVKKRKNNNLIIIILFFISISSLLFYYNKNKLLSNKIFINKILKPRNTTWLQGNRKEILDKYFIFMPEKYIEKNSFKDIFSLKIFDDDDKDTKKIFFDKMTKKFRKNASLVNTLFITKSCNFGNQICSLNNIIFYSEILGIKNIYLNSKFDNWYIKNNIITDKLNISIVPSYKINCQSQDTFCGHIFYDFFFPVVYKPTRRSLILKDEIKRNLPKVYIDKDDLFIHIRAGNVFEKTGNSYTPPPYCFYQKVLEKNKFKNIYLMSVDDKSPIIGKLISDYPKIIHKFHSLKEDIATLMNAYNLVNSISSFSQEAISFNDNILNLWEYDIYNFYDKIYHFHHDIDKLKRKFNIYKMKPSENYANEMYNWRNEEFQKKLMIEEKCKYDFVKIKS